MRSENALNDGRHQRCRWSFTSHVTQGKAEGAAGEIQVVEEVTADRAARHRRPDRDVEGTLPPWFWQERLLYL